jgi:hypothetical protein
LTGGGQPSIFGEKEGLFSFIGRPYTGSRRKSGEKAAKEERAQLTGEGMHKKARRQQPCYCLYQQNEQRGEQRAEPGERGSRSGAEQGQNLNEPRGNPRTTNGRGRGLVNLYSIPERRPPHPITHKTAKFKRGIDRGGGYFFIGDLTRRRSDPAQLLPICHPIKQQEATERTGRGQPSCCKNKKSAAIFRKLQTNPGDLQAERQKMRAGTGNPQPPEERQRAEARTGKQGQPLKTVNTF